MLYIEGHRSTIFSSYTRSLPLSCYKKYNKVLQPKKILRSLFLWTLGLLAVLLNPRFPIFSFSKVFADGIQSNPGLNNHYIKSASHRAYHQGKETFGEAAGI